MAGVLSHMWYVKAAGRVWGPYPEARVADFVREGRVGTTTLVSPFASGPFAPAGASPEFAPLFSAVPPGLATPHPAPSAAFAAPAAIPAAAAALAYAEPDPAAEPAAESGPLRPLLVWAQLSDAALRTFPAALAAFGPGVAIRPGLWLVQARMGPAALRNLLSRRLGAEDALMVVEAPLEQAAWFNVDPARDRELRRLWAAKVS